MKEKISKIRVLNPLVANMIAAGEVIERPSAVVKELIENAVDAGSKKINIIVSCGGKELIKVSDDGFGIRKDELKLSILRHATSKLKLDDLSDITSYGFRGEALPSIAAISKLKIVSKTANQDLAYQISLESGKIRNFEPTNRGNGTSVIVQNLFFNVPARKKFLKSDRSENSMILNCVRRLALSRPDIVFKYTSIDGFGEEKTLDLLADQFDRNDLRLGQIFGSQFLDNRFKISTAADGFSIEGYASIPTETRGNSGQQFFFVNTRPISNKSLSYALKVAYGDFLPRGRYCSAIINIYCDPNMVDVNVHPTKEEVRFASPSELSRLIIYGVRDGISSMGIKTSASLTSSVKGALSRGTDHQNTIGGFSELDSEKPFLPDTQMGETSMNSVKFLIDGSLSYDGAEKMESLTAREKENFPSLGYAVAHVHGNYIITRTLDGLAFVDQHAAHERLVYEKLKNEYYGGGKKNVQSLLIPEIIELGEADAQAILGSKSELSNFGLEIDSFGVGTISVSAVPAILVDANIEELIKDLLADFVELTKENQLSSKIDEILSKVACHASIRSGRILMEEEMNALLRKIESVPFSAQCNHGRPTYIELSLKDIEKLFGRR